MCINYDMSERRGEPKYSILFSFFSFFLIKLFKILTTKDINKTTTKLDSFNKTPLFYPNPLTIMASCSTDIFLSDSDAPASPFLEMVDSPWVNQDLQESDNADPNCTLLSDDPI